MTLKSTNEYHSESSSASRPYTFDRVVRLLITAIIIGASLWLLTVLKDVLLPFLVAWLIAYLLEPFVQYNKCLLHVRKRWLPILMTLFEVVLLIAAIAVFVVPSIIEETHHVAAFVKSYAHDGAHIPFIPETIHEYIRQNIDFERIYSKLTTEDINSILEKAVSVIAGGYNFIMGIFSWFIVLLYVVFIMLDYERLLEGFRRLVPPKYRKKTFAIANDVKESMNHYFRGQALVALLVGILFSIGFLIVGLPMAIVLGLFIGLLNMVPYLQIISIVPTTLLCLVCSAGTGVGFWNIWWSCMAVYVVVQCIQDLFLTPKIMGKVMGLNPAIILLSLSIWGTLLGFIGLIIALPLTTLILAYYDQYIINRNDGESPRRKRQDEESFKKIIEAPEDSEQ